MTHDLVILVLNALAVVRLTFLFYRDTITAPLRAEYRIKRWGVAFRPGELFGCPWCVSIWAGILVVVLSDTWHSWPYVAAALSFSAVAGLVAERF